MNLHIQNRKEAVRTFTIAILHSTSEKIRGGCHLLKTILITLTKMINFTFFITNWTS